MQQLSDYELLDCLHTGPSTRVSAARRRSDSAPVVVKQGTNPSRQRSALIHEYELGQRCKGPGVIDYVALVEDGPGVGIVMAPGGKPLSDMPRGGQLPLARLLQLAKSIALALDTVHRAGVVHADVSPHNLLVGDGDVVSLIDFGASRVRSTRVQAEDEGRAVGTLEYVSPELTGRMRRAIDERADLYSMGAIWFELAAGRPPFACETPLDYVHAHMASAPPSLAGLRPELPGWFCRMVEKLLSKSPEQRYQSAHGVVQDLAGFEAGSLAPDAPLGHNDVSDRLRTPDTLHEREGVMRAIAEAVQAAGKGGAATLLVRGDSGAGKTAVLQHQREALSASGLLFTSGRFDPQRYHHPYSAIRVTLDGLAMALAERPEAERDRRRGAIVSALGSNARVLADLSPALGAFLGPTEAVLELGPSETLNRLHGAFRALWSACGEADKPLVVLLDDLQWIDPSSAELLRVSTVVAPPSHFCVVGAYRPTGEESAGALGPLLKALEGADSHREVVTEPLSIEAVRRLVAEVLADQDADELADEVHRLTRGTAYFVLSALTALHEREALWFDRHERQWAWDLAKVRAQGLSDNVIDLISGSLRELPDRTVALVCAAALAGRPVSAAQLASITGDEVACVGEHLAPALARDLLASGPEGYGFVDERVREAATELVPEASHARLHRAIADELLAGRSIADLGDDVLEVVGHLVAAEAPASSEARTRDARLYREAAKLTARAMAHLDTVDYLRRAIDLYGDAHRQSQPQDWFALKLECATAMGWSGDMEASDQGLTECLEAAQTPVQRAQVSLIRTAQAAQVSSDYAVALVHASDALRDLGLDMPDVNNADAIGEALAALQSTYAQLMEGRDVPSLADLPDNTDERDQLTMSLLAAGLDCAMIGVPAALPIFVINMVNYSIRHGNTDSAALGYMWFGVLQYMGENYALATAFSDTSMALHNRRPNPRQTPAVLNMLGGFIQHLQVAFATAAETCRQTVLEGERIGEYVYGSYGLVNTNRQLLRAGAPLADVRADAAAGIARLLEYGNTAMADLTRVHDGFARALSQDQVEAVGRLDYDDFTEQDFCETYKPAPVLEPLLHTYRVMLNVFQGRYAEAWEVMGQIARPAMLGQVEHSLLNFYAAFAWFASDPADGELQGAAAEVKVCTEALDALAAQCPLNYGACAHLVRAERARVEGDMTDAELAYEAAIGAAEKAGHSHLHGLACERASVFFEKRGLVTAARAYFQQALAAYSQWGATLRVRQLSAARPQWSTASHGTATRSLNAASLDAAAIAEATRIISSDVELEGFLSRTMGVVLKSSGAQSGVLFTQLDGQWWRQAQADLSSVTVDTDHPMQADGTYAHTVTDFAMQAHQAVVLPDPEDEARFSDDPYLAAKQPGSVLCVPLLRRGELAGLLYLEHHEARGAFTQQRVELLETLLAQAAISLEHAYLHRNMDRLVQQRTQQLEEARDAAAAAHANARMVLDSVEQGLVLVRPDGQMQGEHSAAVERWLGRPEAGAPVWSLFEAHDETVALSLELGFESVAEGIMPTEVTLDCLPTRVTVNERKFALEYHPVYDGEDLRHVLVITTDITAQLAAEAATQAQRDLLAFFTHLNHDPRPVFGFLADARALVATVADGAGDDAEVQRHLHTLKGNASFFGLAGFAGWVHGLEDRVAEQGGICQPADRHALAERWQALETQLAPVISSDTARLVTVDRKRFQTVIEQAEAGLPGAQLAQRLREWEWDEVGAQMERLGEQAEALAERLGKGHAHISVSADELCIPPSEAWSSFWSALVHVVRNALDHGVDTVEERAAAGKPEQAQVNLRAAIEGTHLRVDIADDGRGVDWERVAARADSLGLPCATPEDRVRALFADGVSTRDVVTDLSGRGVGTAAVSAACQALGGEVAVASEAGRGTRFSFSIPLAAGAHQPNPVAAVG